jgi:ribosomal protein L31
MSATTDKIQKDSIVAFCKKTECTFVSIWEEQFIPVDEVSFSSHPFLEEKLP